MAKKIRKDDMILTGEFANIMGVCGNTIRNNVYHGYLNEIRMVRTQRGCLYHIFDVFKYAHPNASNDTLERMIFDYRTARLKQKRAARAKNKKLRDAKRQGVKTK